MNLLSSPIFRSKFLHYFVVILSLVFLFTLGPRILVDQLTSSNPNMAIAQDCGQQPCPPVPVPPQPPQECSTSCQPGQTGTCGGHKYWDEASGSYGDCQCETAAQTCTSPTPPSPTPAPPPPGPACTPDEVAGTTQHCVGTQMCTFNVHHRANCDTYEGGAYGCQNSASCGFATPPPTHINQCGDLPVGQSTCRDHHQVFCKANAPECDGNDCIVDTGASCGIGGSNPPPPPSTPCTDQLTSCSCSGTSFVCNHQHNDCSVVSETHNELSGASACPTPTTCTDQLLNCACNGINFQCTHQKSNCDQVTEVHNELGGASACQTVTPPPPPAPNPPPAPPAPPAPVPPPPAQGGSSVSNSNANASANASANQSQNQSQSQSSVNVNNNNNTNNNTQNQTVNVAGIAWASPVPTATPTPTSTTTTTTVTRIILAQGGGVVAGVTAPQVVGKTQVQGQVQELPNTGLPLAGLALLGFVPVGWKLRKYAFQHLNPSSIWTDRELKK